MSQARRIASITDYLRLMTPPDMLALNRLSFPVLQLILYGKNYHVPYQVTNLPITGIRILVGS